MEEIYFIHRLLSIPARQNRSSTQSHHFAVDLGKPKSQNQPKVHFWQIVVLLGTYAFIKGIFSTFVWMNLLLVFPRYVYLLDHQEAPPILILLLPNLKSSNHKSDLRYCSDILYETSSTNLNLPFSIQRKAIRLIDNTTRSTNIPDLTQTFCSGLMSSLQIFSTSFQLLTSEKLLE